MSKSELKLDATPEDAARLQKIAVKAIKVYRTLDKVKREHINIWLDLVACHLNGCPLDIDKLANFDNFNLLHDIAGINKHLDHKTGKLQNHFRPRSAA